jgi:hypothetical protein
MPVGVLGGAVEGVDEAVVEVAVLLVAVREPSESRQRAVREPSESR